MIYRRRNIIIILIFMIALFVYFFTLPKGKDPQNQSYILNEVLQLKINQSELITIGKLNYLLMYDQQLIAKQRKRADALDLTALDNYLTQLNQLDELLKAHERSSNRFRFTSRYLENAVSATKNQTLMSRYHVLKSAETLLYKEKDSSDVAAQLLKPLKELSKSLTPSQKKIIHNKIELYLEDFTQLNDRKKDLKAHERALNKELDQVIGILRHFKGYNN